MNQRDRTILKRGRIRRFHRLDVHLQRLHDLERHPTFHEYLDRVELEIVWADPRQPIRGRIAQFSGMTFVHASLPPMDVAWNRLLDAREMALLIMAKKGSITVSGTDRVISRGVTAHLVLPSTDRTIFHMSDFGTEIAYMIVPGALFSDIRLPEPGDFGDLAFSRLAPTFYFTSSICAMSTTDVEDPEPLRSVASEIVRSTLRMVFGAEGDDERSRFGAAMEIILRGYTSKALDIGLVAKQLGVSTRMLQLAFQQQNTRFSVELRNVRAAAAMRLRDENPDMTLAQLAAACGFGSVASLQRALRAARSQVSELV